MSASAQIGTWNVLRRAGDHCAHPFPRPGENVGGSFAVRSRAGSPPPEPRTNRAHLLSPFPRACADPRGASELDADSATHLVTCHNSSCRLPIAPSDILCPDCSRRKTSLTRMVSVALQPARQHLAEAIISETTARKTAGAQLETKLPLFSVEQLQGICTGYLGLPRTRVRQTKGFKGRRGAETQQLAE